MVKLNPRDRRPIYKQIEEQFIEMFRSRKLLAHALMPTAVQLGESLKISHLTVREAYKRLAQQGYIYSIRGKGTFVVDRRTDETLALTAPSEFFRSPGNSGVYGALADTLYQLARDSGKVLKLIVLTTPYLQQVRGELNAHDMASIRETPTRGLFVSGYRLPSSITRELRTRGVRLVGLCEGVDHATLEDQAARFNLPLTYAYSRGRRNVGLIYLDLGDHPKLKDRLLQAMQQAGFEPDSARVVGVNSASMVGGQVAAEYLLEGQPKLDAMICYDDLLAHGMCMACVKRRVQVPKNVLLMAHANKGITAPFVLPVARFTVDVRAMVHLAYEKMCALLENRRGAAAPTLVQPMLVPEYASSTGEFTDVVLNVA